VKVPQDLLNLLIVHGKLNYLSVPSVHGRRIVLSNMTRIAVTNCIHQSPGGKDYQLSEIWDRLGRWASNLRGMKEIEGITERHQAWAHIQRLRYAIQRASNDPALQNRLKYPINRFLVEALLAWDNAMEAHFKENSEDLMTPDEYAGMVELPFEESVDGIAIFVKPPKPEPRPVREDVITTPDAQVVETPKVQRRPQQRASLFGPKLRDTETINSDIPN